MLNGIGGRSVAEAKQRLSHAEVMAWVAYRSKHGSLSVGFRIEQAGAIVALQTNRLAGGQAELLDFMPTQARAPVDLDEAMDQWV